MDATHTHSYTLIDQFMDEKGNTQWSDTLHCDIEFCYDHISISSVMNADGTRLGRNTSFLHKDELEHNLNNGRLPYLSRDGQLSYETYDEIISDWTDYFTKETFEFIITAVKYDLACM
jgi:hypothetical protein